MTSSTVNANLTGTFDKIKDAATGSFTTDYPTWVASTDNDQLNGTITPSAAVDSHLAGLSVSSCVLHITSFALKVTGAVGSPLHPNLASQIAPLSSALPLAFSIPPSINIGPLSAPSTGAGNIVVALIKISGTADCYTSGGTAVVTNGAVVYSPHNPTIATTSFGTPQVPGGVSGTVTDNATPTPNDISNASVQVCTIDLQCDSTYSAANGSYSVTGLQPGPYYVTVLPPAGSSGLDAGQFGLVSVVANTITSNTNVVLDATQPLPAGVTVSNNGSSTQSNGEFEYNSLPFNVSMTGCSGGTATWEIQGWNRTTAVYTTLTGPMTENPTGSGVYQGTIPPVFPMHGPMNVTLAITCPNSTVQTAKFRRYIDPSGTVFDQNGNPVSGATVTLFDSSSLNGPWSQVANGDTSIMSPANAENPYTSGGVGQYGWDVTPGFYEVTATAAGCSSVTSPPLTIPPPVVDLNLTIVCGIPTGDVSLVSKTTLALSGSVACSSVKGDTAGTITIGKCLPKNKTNVTATATGASLTTGGTLTWSSSGQTTVLSSLDVSSPGQGGCKSGSTEYDVSGTVVGGTSTYTQDEGAVSGQLCVT